MLTRRCILRCACLVHLAACEVGEAKRDPTGDRATEPASWQLASPERLAAARAALDDAGTRLVGSLEDRVGAAILRIHLGELALRLEAGDEAGTRRALASTRQALDQATDVGPGHTSPGSAIRRVLDDVQALLDGREVRPGCEPAGGSSPAGCSRP